MVYSIWDNNNAELVFVWGLQPVKNDEPGIWWKQS